MAPLGRLMEHETSMENLDSAEFPHPTGAHGDQRVQSIPEPWVTPK